MFWRNESKKWYMWAYALVSPGLLLQMLSFNMSQGWFRTDLKSNNKKRGKVWGNSTYSVLEWGVRWDLNPAPSGDVTHNFLFFFVAMVRANRSSIKLDLRNWLIFFPFCPKPRCRWVYFTNYSCTALIMLNIVDYYGASPSIAREISYHCWY